MRKLLALAACLALVLSLGGCMADPSVETPLPGGVAPPEVQEPGPSLEPALSPFADRGMRLALCTSPGAVDDRAHNASCYDGVLDFIISRNLIDTVTPLQETTGSADSAFQSLQNQVLNYDAMVCVGPAYSGIAEIAKAYPEKYFILVDATPTGDADNLSVLNFAEQECGFFAGVAAAMETKTGRVAVINSVVNDINTRYYYGFRSGVAYTNGNYGTTAEVIDLPGYAGVAEDGTYLGGNFTQSVTDQSAGRALAQSLIDEGCDVLFVAADSSGKGAFTAAKAQKDVWIIGAEGDQFTQGESNDRNVVLTSVTKSMTLEVERRLKSIIDGPFQSGNLRLDASDNATSFVSTDDHQQLKEETMAVLSDVYPLMQNGTIVPGSGPQ